MTAESVSPDAPGQGSGSLADLPGLPLPGATPREICDALHPEYRDAFNREYRTALDEAGESLELTGVLEVVESWRMRA